MSAHAWYLFLLLPLLVSTADYSISQLGAVIFNETSLICAHAAAEEVLFSCTYNSSREEAFQKIISRNFTKCMEDNGTLSSNEGQSVQIMVPLNVYSAYSKLKDAYGGQPNKQSSLEVAVVPVDMDQLLQEALFEFENDLSTVRHAWVMYLDTYFPLERLSALQDLTNFTKPTGGGFGAVGNWSDISPEFRRFSFSYYQDEPPPIGKQPTPKLYGIPLDGSAPLMYYRTDILAAKNLSVPRTWSEVLHVAKLVNGTTSSDGAAEEFALCFKPDPDCSYASALGMVLTPYLQYAGTAQGALLRPEDLQPLFDNLGAAEALGLFQQLLTYHVPLAVQGEECIAEVPFPRGHCVISFGWGDIFKASQVGNLTRIKGKVGVAMLPGSEVVFVRDRHALEPCTAELCPHGLGNMTEQIQRMTDGSSVYVNRAPYMPYAGLVGIVASKISPEQQAVAVDFMSFVLNANLELSLSADNNYIVPYRSSILDGSDLSEFVAHGFDGNATQAYTAAILDTINHRNLVPGPVIPRAEAMRQVMGIAAVNLSRGAPVEEVAQLLQQQVVDEVLEYASDNGWRMDLKSAYWRFIDYNPNAGNNTGDGGPGSVDMPAVSLAVPVASAVVVLLLSTLYEFKKHRQHRSLFGKVVAPGPFEDTTLLVTDIQDSTALWEMLPSSVMDRAIKEHHTCLRKLLLKHSGYESATEGDSFLLAFHCPEDALLFAMESQVALLECAWPMELLDCEVCRPYYVVHNDTDKRATLLADSGDAVGGLMALPRANSGLSNKSTSEDTSSPQASNLLGPPGVEVNTFITACQASWKEATATTPNNVLIFRGLRVRMGMHTGISNEADVAYNKAAARMQYSGEILQYGKSVSDAAAGGMILLSETTYRRLPMERLWDKAMVMHVGEYKLKDDLPVLPLYQVTGRRLMGRLGYLSGMRFKEQLSKGVFTAPLGAVAMAYMGVVGASTLLAWDEAVARESLSLLHGCVAEAALKWKGYLAEATDEQVHVVFPAAAEALLWALAVHQVLMELAWPEALLDHELAEELIVGDLVVFRGLRVKSGIDVGHAVGEVNALTGRICYRGKVVARAARVMQSASSNQVLTSGEAWAAAQASSAAVLQLRGVVGDRLGPFKLRGLADKVEMVQVRLQRPDLAGADGWAQDLQEDGAEGAAGGMTTDSGREPDDGGGVGGGGASAAPSRPGTASILPSIVPGGGGGGGGSERPSSAPRPFTFLSRASRSNTIAMPPSAAAASPAVGDDGFGGNSPLVRSSGGSPRLLGSILRSVRAQSFTAGLLHRMATVRGRGVQRNNAAGLVDASPGSAVSATTADAAAAGGGGGSGSGGATPPIAIHTFAAAASATAAGVSSAEPSNHGGTSFGAPPASDGSVKLLRSIRNGGGGGAAASVTGSGGGGAAASVTGSGGGIAAGTARAISPSGSWQPFPFPSARKLLPSGWHLGGGGGSGMSLSAGSGAGGALASSGPRAAGVATSGGLNALAAMVATSLPASRATQGHLSNTAPAAEMEQLDVSVAGGGAAAAAGGGAAGAAGAGTGGAGEGCDGPLSGSPDGPGWFPGEMLADVLHGVQEEDERGSGRGSLVAAHRVSVS